MSNTKTDIEWLEARIALRDKRMAEALARLEQWRKEQVVFDSRNWDLDLDLCRLLTVEEWEDVAL